MQVFGTAPLLRQLFGFLPVSNDLIYIYIFAAVLLTQHSVHQQHPAHFRMRINSRFSGVQGALRHGFLDLLVEIKHLLI